MAQTIKKAKKSEQKAKKQTKNLKEASQDFAHQASLTTKTLANHAKKIACEKGEASWGFVKNHPKEMIALAVAGLGVLGWAQKRKGYTMPKMRAKENLIEPLVAKTDKAREAVADFIRPH